MGFSLTLAFGRERVPMGAVESLSVFSLILMYGRRGCNVGSGGSLLHSDVRPGHLLGGGKGGWWCAHVILVEKKVTLIFDTVLHL
jgi:hypothetical protein